MTKKELVENRCAYCGVTATCFDHVPPLVAYPPSYKENRRKGSKLRNLPGVYSCHECNSALGAKFLLTVKERALYIHSWLARRYAKLLAFPEWSQEELEQLEPTLRTSVLTNLRKKVWIKHRMAIANCSAFPADDDEDNLISEYVLEEI